MRQKFWVLSEKAKELQLGWSPFSSPFPLLTPISFSLPTSSSNSNVLELVVNKFQPLEEALCRCFLQQCFLKAQLVVNCKINTCGMVLYPILEPPC